MQKGKRPQKSDIADIADNKVVDFILELVQNLYCGDSPYGPETREYKITCAFLNVIDSFLNTIGFKLGKVLKGATTARALVEPLLWNNGICDEKATLKLYPLNDGGEKATEPKDFYTHFEDPVKKSKKGPLVLLILILCVILLLAIIAGVIALVVWAVIAIVHAVTGSIALGLLL